MIFLDVTFTQILKIQLFFSYGGYIAEERRENSLVKLPDILPFKTKQNLSKAYFT